MALKLPVLKPGPYNKVVSRGDKYQTEKGEIPEQDGPGPCTAGREGDKIIVHIQVESNAGDEIVEEVDGYGQGEIAGAIDEVAEVDAKNHKGNQTEGIQMVCPENDACNDCCTDPPDCSRQ
jgi:hypothetical protein